MTVKTQKMSPAARRMMEARRGAQKSAAAVEERTSLADVLQKGNGDSTARAADVEDLNVAGEVAGLLVGEKVAALQAALKSLKVTPEMIDVSHDPAGKTYLTVAVPATLADGSTFRTYLTVTDTSAPLSAPLSRYSRPRKANSRD